MADAAARHWSEGKITTALFEDPNIGHFQVVLEDGIPDYISRREQQFDLIHDFHDSKYTAQIDNYNVTIFIRAGTVGCVVETIDIDVHEDHEEVCDESIGGVSGDERELMLNPGQEEYLLQLGEIIKVDVIKTFTNGNVVEETVTLNDYIRQMLTWQNPGKIVQDGQVLPLSRLDLTMNHLLQTTRKNRGYSSIVDIFEDELEKLAVLEARTGLPQRNMKGVRYFHAKTQLRFDGEVVPHDCFTFDLSEKTLKFFADRIKNTSSLANDIQSIVSSAARLNSKDLFVLSYIAKERGLKDYLARNKRILSNTGLLAILKSPRNAFTGEEIPENLKSFYKELGNTEAWPIIVQAAITDMNSSGAFSEPSLFNLRRATLTSDHVNQEQLSLIEA